MATRFNLLLIICLLLSFKSYSQGIWREGEVKLQNGQLLSGLVLDQEWTKYPEEIEFKTAEGQASKKFDATSVLYFTTNRPARYEVHKTSFDGDLQHVNNLPNGRETKNPMKGQYFLEVLIDSPIGLLFLTDKNSRDHFFLKKDTMVVELLNRLYRSEGDVARVTDYKVNEKYKQELLSISVECPKLKQTILNSKYSEASLKKVIESILSCKGIEQASPQNAVKTKSQIGVTIQGISSKSDYAFFSTKFNGVSPSIGLSYESFNKRRPKRISTYSELLFRNLNQELFVVTTDILGNKSYASNGRLHASKIKLNTLFRSSYTSNDGMERFFWNVGVSNGICFKTETDYKKQDYPVSHQFGILAGFGKTFTIKQVKLSLEFRYELESDPLASSATEFILAHNLGIISSISLAK
jgi:hypothetical protein